MARVESCGVEILEGVCGKSGARGGAILSFYFRDPYGNPIEASGGPEEAERPASPAPS